MRPSAAVFVVVLLLLAAGTQSASAADLQQSSCATEKRAVAGAESSRDRAKAETKLKQCKLNLKIYQRLSGIRLVGTGLDGAPFDIAYCTKKRVVTSGLAYNRGWNVEVAKRTAAGIRAQVSVATSGGFTSPHAVRLHGDSWEVGSVNISRPFLRDFAPAKMADRGEVC